MHLEQSPATSSTALTSPALRVAAGPPAADVGRVLPALELTGVGAATERR